MVIYITDEEENEVIRIEEVDEENNDFRIGVYDEVKRKLIKTFDEKNNMEKILTFADKYFDKNYKGKGKK